MTTLTAIQTTNTTPAPVVSARFDMLDSERMVQMMESAKMMATARVTVPKHLAGSPGDCMAIIMMAMQHGMNPFALAQKTHLINGVIGYEAQLVNAIVSSSSLLATRLNYDWYGPWERVIGKFAVKKNSDGKEYRVPNWSAQDEEGCGVRVWAMIKGETDPRKLDLLLTQARTRNSTLWADDPRQQLAYLAVKRWARLHTPDVMLGVYTVDEIEAEPERAMGEAQVVDDTPRPATRTAGIKDKLKGRAKASTEQEPAPAGPTLDAVMAAIGAAATTEDLSAVKPMINALNGSDRAAAIEAGKLRSAALATPTLNPTDPYSIEDILIIIAEARNEDEIAAAMEDAADLPDADRARAVQAADERRAALGSAA